MARRGPYTVVEHDLLDSPAFADLSGTAVKIVLQILRDVKAANHISHFDPADHNDLVPVVARCPAGMPNRCWRRSKHEVQEHGFATFANQRNGLSDLVSWSYSWRTWTPTKAAEKWSGLLGQNVLGTQDKMAGVPGQNGLGTQDKMAGVLGQNGLGTQDKMAGVSFLIQDFKTNTTTTKAIEDEFGGGGGAIELDPKRVKKRATEYLNGREWMTWAEAYDFAVKELTYKAKLELGQFAGMTNARLATALRISLKELETVLAVHDPALVRSEAARMLKDAEEGRARSATALFRAQFCKKTPGLGTSQTAPDIAVG